MSTDDLPAGIGELIRLLRRARQLRDVPPVTDQAAFRLWLARAAAWCSEAAQQTDTAADDRAAQVLRTIVASPGAWPPFYAEVVRVLTAEAALPSLAELHTVANLVRADWRDVMAIYRILVGALALQGD